MARSVDGLTEGGIAAQVLIQGLTDDAHDTIDDGKVALLCGTCDGKVGRWADSGWYCGRSMSDYTYGTKEVKYSTARHKGLYKGGIVAQGLV